DDEELLAPRALLHQRVALAELDEVGEFRDPSQLVLRAAREQRHLRQQLELLILMAHAPIVITGETPRLRDRRPRPSRPRSRARTAGIRSRLPGAAGTPRRRGTPGSHGGESRSAPGRASGAAT